MSVSRTARATGDAGRAAVDVFGCPVSPRLIAEGGHIVVRLDPLPVVARVGLRGEGCDPQSAARTLRLARALEPAAAAPLPAEPSVTAETVVTFHPFIDGRRPEMSSGDLEVIAASLKALHCRMLALSPGLSPFTAEIARLARAIASVGPLGISLMQSIRADVRRLWAGAPKLVPVHGDANPGNALVTPGGVAWIDFECVCLAPVEWDVALLPAAAAGAFDADPERLEICRAIRARMYRAWSLVHPLRKNEAAANDGAYATSGLLHRADSR